jgi:hypothetical protein
MNRLDKLQWQRAWQRARLIKLRWRKVPKVTMSQRRTTRRQKAIGFHIIRYTWDSHETLPKVVKCRMELVYTEQSLGRKFCLLFILLLYSELANDGP